MYFVEKLKPQNPYKRFDYLLFFSVLILSVIGLFVLNSAVFDKPNILKSQVLAFIMGKALC